MIKFTKLFTLLTISCILFLSIVLNDVTYGADKAGAIFLRVPLLGNNKEGHERLKEAVKKESSSENPTSQKFNNDTTSLFRCFPISEKNMPLDFKGWFFPVGSLFNHTKTWDPWVNFAERAYGPHTGLDWAFYLIEEYGRPGKYIAKYIPAETEVLAINKGIVEIVNEEEEEIIVDHDGTLVAYKHVKPLGIKVDDELKAGQVIATISGRTDGGVHPHLHITFYRVIDDTGSGIKKISPFDPAEDATLSQDMRLSDEVNILGHGSAWGFILLVHKLSQEDPEISEEEIGSGRRVLLRRNDDIRSGN